MGVVPASTDVGCVRIVNTSSRSVDREVYIAPFKEIIRMLRGSIVANNIN